MTVEPLPMRPPIRFAALCAALALVAAAPAALAAPQEEPATDPGPGPDVFGEVIDVRVVNVEVVVTDRDGNRVTGLGPADFRLFVDGEPAAIDYFSEIVGGRAKRAEDASVAAAPGAAEGTVGTSYLVFVDDTFSVAHDRDEVLLALADDLDFLRPGDRMAIVAFDGRGVDMLTSWTDSHRQLRRALSDAQARPASGLARLAERRAHDMALVSAMTARSFDSFVDLSAEDRFFAQEIAGQVERAVDAAVAALRGFAQPPGRKVMLLLAGGWPFSPAAYAADTRKPILEGAVPDGPELLRPLVDTANLLGYTLYPIDLPGLGSWGGAERQDPFSPEIAALGLGTTGDNSSVIGSFDRELNAEQALSYLAHETGGRALINARRLRPLEAVDVDTRSYYWLGFSPERQGDDRRHDIRVELTRPGLRARSRGSYLDLSRDAERQMAVESALLFGDPAAEGHLAVRVGEAKRAGRRRVEVPLSIAVPVELVTLLPTSRVDEWAVRLELRIGALDERQRRSDIATVPIEMTFREKPEAGKFIPYTLGLTMRDVEQTLVVSVTDAASGQSLTARVPVAP